GPPDDDVAVDRQVLERPASARERRVLGRLHVGTAEPARTRERSAFGDAGEALAGARPPDAALRLTQAGSCSRAASCSTSSITSPIVRSTFVFSITGTRSCRALDRT